MEHPNLDQVERDFCSARQVYAQARQEEVTEERDLRPIPKKHLEYEVSQGGVDRGSTMTETAHPRHHSNHLHELFYGRRS